MGSIEIEGDKVRAISMELKGGDIARVSDDLKRLKRGVALCVFDHLDSKGHLLRTASPHSRILLDISSA